MANNKIYFTTRHSATELVNHMHDFLANNQGMNTQRIHNAVGDFTMIQARTKGGKLKQIIGLDKAVTLRFTETSGTVNVEIGEAKWIDKSIVMTVSMFVLWPLTVTSGVGIYKQKKLISDIMAEMDSYMVYVLDSKSVGETSSGFSEKIETKMDGISMGTAYQPIAGNEG